MCLLAGHLRKGLHKLKEAETLVSDMGAKLEVQQADLHQQQEAAQQAMDKIMKETAKATKQSEAMQAAKADMEEERKALKKEADKIRKKLSNVQPMLDAAKDAVGQINQRSFSEIRNFASPPIAVHHVLQGVLLLMGQRDGSLRAIKAFLGDKNGIKSIMQFDSRNISPDRRRAVEELLREKGRSFEPDVIEHASKTVAPVAAWVLAQLEYARVLEKIEPAIRRRDELEQSLDVAHAKVKELEKNTAVIQKKITRLQGEVQEKNILAGRLQVGVEGTQRSMQRASQLVEALGNEGTRWERQLAAFERAKRVLPLHAVLAAGFATYLSGCAEHVRRDRLDAWTQACPQLGEAEADNFDYLSFMSTESEQLRWKADGLPADGLSMENAAVILNAVRDPLIIDPSGQACAWLRHHLQSEANKPVQAKAESESDDEDEGEPGSSGSRVVFVLSAGDPRFTTELALAVRFGKTLILEDVDGVEPMLYPLLRRDLASQGSRHVVQIGEKAVDYNPAFRLYMTTKNPRPNLPPDACGLVSVVNFTVTRSGLESQLLSVTLKHEQPQLEEQKSELLRQEEEQKVSLARLEKELLETLAASEGNILENEALIQSLRETKEKSALIAQALSLSQENQVKLDEERNKYRPIALVGSQMFFIISDLSKLNNMYRFSLAAFMSLFEQAFVNKLEYGNSESRNADLASALRGIVINYVSRSLFKTDRLPFGLHLVHLLYPQEFQENEWEVFVGRVVGPGSAGGIVPEWIASDRADAYATLRSSFPSLVQSVRLDDGQLWQQWARELKCEEHFPKVNVRITPFQQVLITQAFRPDRLNSVLHNFVCGLLSVRHLSPPAFNLQRLAEEETDANTPVLLVATAGADPSIELEEVALRCVGRERFEQLAMGQGQADAALAALRNAARSGGWLCLKNLHLVIPWLGDLEKELGMLRGSCHEDFRLWLTTEQHESFPAILLASSLKVTYEAPPGIKKNMLRTYETWDAQFVAQGSVLRAQTLFVLAFFHAVMQERRSYMPQGWCKFYEFSVADLRVATQVVEKEFTKEDGPQWATLHGLIQNAIYGGRVDNGYDMRVVVSYLKAMFNDQVLSRLGSSQALAPNLQLPNSANRQDFIAAIQQLPNHDAPAMFGLPANVDRSVQQTASALVIDSLKRLEVQLEATRTFNRDVWSGALRPLLQQWHSMTTGSRVLEISASPVDATHGPLVSFLSLETRNACGLVATVHGSLSYLDSVLRGSALVTPTALEDGATLMAGTVPRKWAEYWEEVTCSVGLIGVLCFILVDLQGPESVQAFMRGLVTRTTTCAQYLALATRGELLNRPIELRSLFRPTTFLNAVRQLTARETGKPMDELKLVSAFGAIQG